MFKSLTRVLYQEDLITHYPTNECWYELEDDEFGTIRIKDSAYDRLQRAELIIVEYSKRNLNVAANLVKFLIYHSTRYATPIDSLWHWLQGSSFLTKELKEKVQKYL